MKTALLYMRNNFPGREYFAALEEAGMPADLVIEVGLFKDEQIAREKERTGGLWNPPPVPENRVHARFDTLKDEGLWRLLEDERIDLALQGGIGILKPDMIAVPRLGFLNCHPGRLPQYRGNACPEWAALNGDEIYATAHFIDGGIDTGPVVLERRYDVSPDWTYQAFRAHLYRHVAATLVEAVKKLARAPDPLACGTPQAEEGAHYWPGLGDAERVRLLEIFPGWRPKEARA